MSSTWQPHWFGNGFLEIVLGYKDLNDRDDVRHDLVMASLAGKLTVRYVDCAPVSVKSTLNQLELSTRYCDALLQDRARSGND